MNVRKIRDGVPAHMEAQVAEHARENRDMDACVELWRTVIERAVMDIQYLQRFEGCKQLKKHELEKLRRIQESPPDDFIEGDWFEEICDYLRVDAQKIRAQLGDYLEQAA